MCYVVLADNNYANKNSGPNEGCKQGLKFKPMEDISFNICGVF